LRDAGRRASSRGRASSARRLGGWRSVRCDRRRICPLPRGASRRTGRSSSSSFAGGRAFRMAAVWTTSLPRLPPSTFRRAMTPRISHCPGLALPRIRARRGHPNLYFFFRERCCLWPPSRPPNAVLSPRYLFPIRIPLYSVIHNSSLYTHYMHAPSKRKKWKSVWSAALRVMD